MQVYGDSEKLIVNSSTFDSYFIPPYSKAMHVKPSLVPNRYIGFVTDNEKRFLKKIPADRRITHLDCAGCELVEAIPKELVNVDTLDCADCPLISEIPKELVRLTKLSCRNCNIKEIPVELGATLMELDCDDHVYLPDVLRRRFRGETDVTVERVLRKRKIVVVLNKRNKK